MTYSDKSMTEKQVKCFLADVALARFNNRKKLLLVERLITKGQ